MVNLYILFHENGIVCDIATEARDGYLPAPANATSTLALRYGLEDGKAVDRHPGKSDAEVLAAIKAEHEKENADIRTSNIMSKVAFMNRFTTAELSAIYTSAKANVQVEILLDKLKLSERVDLAAEDVIAGVQALVAAKLLTGARAAALLQ